MTDFEENIYRVISGGKKEAPVTREQLTKLTGENDRLIRKTIQRLQQRGCTIVSLRKGYYVPTNKDDLEHYKKREMRRAFTILNKVRHLFKDKELIKQLKLSF